MFIGHYAVSFAAKRFAPRTSLGTLVAATSFADLLWPMFLLTGWERVTSVGGSNPFLTLHFDSYPISHSLLTLIGWGVLFAVAYGMRTRYTRGAAVVGLLVISHWLLDFVVHVPDLPLYPGSPKFGLELWRSMLGTVLVEGVMFVAGVAIYLSATRARDRVGRYAAPGLAVLFALLYVGSLFSPPPPNTRALAMGAIVFGWLLVGLAAWADAHRESASPGNALPGTASGGAAVPR